MVHTPPFSLDKWLEEHARQDLLRFLTCGSVDDGKSTLIGRLLWECGQIYDDHAAALLSDSKRHGTQGEQIDYALLMDGLTAEREQGITIDVAYRFFSTSRRKFIVADTPGHEQYTRNMVTGASTASVAILLIDARKGVLVQTRRHAYLASLMGIRNLALAVNKMDLVDYDPGVFEAIRADFLTFVRQLGPLRVEAIPLSALQNENLLTPSSQMPWYEGPTLLHYLETVEARPQGEARVILPVQMSLRPDGHFRGVIGTLASGTIRPGDALCATTSGQTARIASMVAMEGPVAEAKAGDAVTIQLDREIDVSRGEVLTSPDAQVEMTDQFEATIVWMHEEPGLIGRRYELKLATQWASASITSIKYRIDVNTMAHEPARQMVLNDICVCNLSANRALPLDSFERSRELGSFLLVDRYSNATVAAGMVRHSLRRAHNIHPHEMTITREARERLQGHAGKVVWFTGLSGAGKSTIANEVEKALHAQGRRTYLLDGDNLRNGLNRDLGFTEADRVENIRRVAEVARLMQDAGLIVLVALISPFRQEREMARGLIGEEHFLEVYVNAPLDVCEARDPKGLYQKARRGEIPNLTGVQAPYEPPLESQLELRTGEVPLEECVASVLALLEASSSR